MILIEALFKISDLLSQSVDVLTKILNFSPILVHEPVRVDLGQDWMLMLLFHQHVVHELLALQLESEYCRKSFDPGSLRYLVSLAILVVLIVWDLITENVLPCLIKVALVLDVEHDV